MKRTRAEVGVRILEKIIPCLFLRHASSLLLRLRIRYLFCGRTLLRWNFLMGLPAGRSGMRRSTAHASEDGLPCKPGRGHGRAEASQHAKRATTFNDTSAVQILVTVPLSYLGLRYRSDSWDLHLHSRDGTVALFMTSVNSAQSGLPHHRSLGQCI